MEPVSIKIRAISHLTHDVVQIDTGKPENFHFIPGQAAEVSINKSGLQSKMRLFSFTNLPEKDFLQFIIKTYPDHKGFTSQILLLERNDELILHNVIGSIAYKGPGLFIAGGAGVTPFIAIFRFLKENNAIGNNRLIFANKTRADIILRHEFEQMLGENFINILSDEDSFEYLHGFVTEELIANQLNVSNSYIYLCGPPPMMKAVEKILAGMHIEEKFLVKERF